MLRIAAVASLSIIALALSTGARAETRSIEVPSFTAARFESALKVNLTVGGEQSIAIVSANGEDLDDVRYEVVNGELHIWTQRDFWDFVSLRDGEITVTVTTPSLNALVASAATEVSATGIKGDDVRISASSAAYVVVDEIEAGSVAIDASSAGRVALSGACDTIDAAVSSTAIVNARDFVCLTAEIDASSASQSVFHVTGDVVAEVSSAANVVLVGDPDHVDDEVGSGGNIDVRN